MDKKHTPEIKDPLIEISNKTKEMYRKLKGNAVTMKFIRLLH
jgi:hypothetical protein